MPYDLLKESTPIMALIIILAYVLYYVLKKFGDNLTCNRLATEKSMKDNKEFVSNVIDKYEKREEKLLNHFDKIDSNQAKITNTLDKMNDKMDRLDEKIQKMENDRR